MKFESTGFPQLGIKEKIKSWIATIFQIKKIAQNTVNKDSDLVLKNPIVSYDLLGSLYIGTQDSL